MDKKKLVLISGIVFLTFSIVLLIICLLYFTFYYLNVFDSDPNRSRKQRTKYMEVNPSNNDTSFGFIYLPRKLHESEYIAYPNKVTGNYVIISNFEGDEYECTGSCYCGDSRRTVATSSSILTRGLYIFISAISTVIATNIALETFHNDCRTRYSDICDVDNIQSRVTMCSRRRNTDKFLGESWGEEWEGNFYVDYRYEWRCSGHCVDTWDSSIPQAVKEWAFDRHNLERCDNIWHENEVVTKTEDELIARQKFVDYGFELFCAENSKYRVPLYEKNVDPYYVPVHLIFLCSGSKKELPYGREQWADHKRAWYRQVLSNVQCVEPRPFREKKVTEKDLDPWTKGKRVQAFDEDEELLPDSVK